MDWLAHIEHLQFFLKEFNRVTAPTNNLLIRYSCNGIRSCIRTQIDEKDYDPDDWQAVVEQAVDAETKVAWHTPSLVRKSDACYSRNHKPLHNEESKDQKDSEAKSNNLSANNNSESRKRGQSGQTSSWFSKKDSYLNKKGQ